MSISLKFYDSYHFGKLRLQLCPLPIAMRLQEHSKTGAGCDSAALPGKTPLSGRLGMRVKGGNPALVLAALVVLVSFSRSFSGLTGRKAIFLRVAGGFRKKKLRLLLCETLLDNQQSFNSLLTGGSALCGFRLQTLPLRLPSVRWGFQNLP